MSQNPTDGRINEVALVIFAKPPVEGEVKTRLARDTGDPVATELYQCFLADIAAMVAAWIVESKTSVEPVLAYTKSPDHPGYAVFREQYYKFWEQGEGDLGARMARVSQRCFDAGAKRVVIIGADSPTLTPAHLQRAITALDTHEVALGPSFDGGYYLVGLRQPSPEIFRGIQWSTDQVLAQTIAACRASSRLCATLEFWYDVDTFDDLIFLKTHLLNVLEEGDPKSAAHTAHYLGKLVAKGVFRTGTHL